MRWACHRGIFRSVEMDLAPGARRRASGIARHFDRNTMTAYVSAVNRVREANRLLPTLTDPAELQACRRELNDATRLMVMVGKELGISPLARGRITMPETAEKVEEENPWQGALRLVPKPS